MGTSTININGPCSIAMLVYQRVFLDVFSHSDAQLAMIDESIISKYPCVHPFTSPFFILDR
jgi:hypothetical protein